MKDDFRPSAAQPNPTEDRDDSDLISLIESYKKEIWEWKQKEAQWIRDKNQLDGNKQIIGELSTKMVELSTRMVEVGKVNLILKTKINELEGTLGSAQGINDNHQRYNGKLQTRLTEVEEDNKKLSKQIQDLNNRKS
jgi:chromosome segregation ATPase